MNVRIFRKLLLEWRDRSFEVFSLACKVLLNICIHACRLRLYRAHSTSMDWRSAQAYCHYSSRRAMFTLLSNATISAKTDGKPSWPKCMVDNIRYQKSVSIHWQSSIKVVTGRGAEQLHQAAMSPSLHPYPTLPYLQGGQALTPAQRWGHISSTQCASPNVTTRLQVTAIKP